MTTVGFRSGAGLSWTASGKKKLAGKLKVIKPFDPYHGRLCTCPAKLTLNVYTGCGFECFYCYTSSYAWGRWGRESLRWGPRKDLLTGLEKDITALAEAGPPLDELPVVISLSSDPYPNSPLVKESDLALTRQCLARLTAAGKMILIQTKSDMVLRDLDVLDPARTLIGLTVTTADPALAARMEPFAPPPQRRIGALAEAAGRGFATVCRVDPLVPGLNDRGEDLVRLVALLGDAGVRQVISSTFKKRPDSSRRFEAAFPQQAAASDELYEPGLIQGYRYLKENVRRELMERLRRIVHRHNMAFSCCREGFADLNDAPCDGRQAMKIEDSPQRRRGHREEGVRG